MICSIWAERIESWSLFMNAKCHHVGGEKRGKVGAALCPAL
jgi:hypothetical protein